MGYQPAAYTIIKRDKFYYIQNGPIEKGPYEWLWLARKDLQKMINSIESVIIEQYNCKGERIV